MTAASVSTISTETAATAPPLEGVAALMAGSVSKMVAAAGTKVITADTHPLEGVVDVADAMPLIANLLEAERKGGKRRVYPRSMLRQQHIVAYMLANPFATTTEICAFFGISAGTLSNIAKSDTFKALLKAHKVSIENSVGNDLQEQLRQTLAVALEVTQKAVIDQQDPEYALAVMDKTANRLGLGAKHNSQTNVQVNVVTPEMIAAARTRRLPGAS